MRLVHCAVIFLAAITVGNADVVSIFDGKTLNGWQGDEKFWQVEGGAITGESTAENPCKQSTYLVYEGKDFSDFELTVSFRFLSKEGNSGIQYRSRVKPDTFDVKGYQADLEVGPNYSGILYDQAGRGIVANRGESVMIAADGNKSVKPLASGALAQKSIKHGEWNEYKIVAEGSVLSHYINGHMTVQVIDKDRVHRRHKGRLAFQLHQGAPMKVQFKDIRLLELDHEKEKADPEWIWSKDLSDQQQVTLIKTFQIDKIPNNLNLSYACDDAAVLYINNQKVGSVDTWRTPQKVKVAKYLISGENEIRVVAKNATGQAGLILRMGDILRSDSSWSVLLSDGRQEAAVSLGGYGVAPWGQIPDMIDDTLESRQVKTLPGFKVEEVYAVDKDTQGSWVSMTFDDRGKLYVSAQYGQLLRLTLKGGKVEKVEKIKSPGMAQGLCWAYGSLYMSVVHGQKGGVYRLTDTNNDGAFDRQEHIVKLNSGGEHGIHGIIKSERGGLYFVAGNHTQFPEAAKSINGNNWQEDVLLDHLLDPRGHANHVKAPGGYVLHFQPDGSEMETLCTGLRNTYDIALSPNGSLFGYDADMEWDAGTPWYRPTRLVHITPGSEYGWRTGTSKWPDYYADSLPPVMEFGPGSPTGLLFGTKAKFPKRYQEALYLLDWTFGRIYVAHLSPDGSSYKGEKEVLLSGSPLPVTDAAIGPDGAMYFTVGGRRLNSRLYRISYTGKVGSENPEHPSPPLASVLNQLLNKPAPGFVWEHLDSPDRRVRYTARVALEVMGAEKWIQMFKQEKNAVKIIEASIALARLEKDSEQLLHQIGSVGFAKLNHTQKLAYLRALGLCLIRNESSMNSNHIAPIRSLLEKHFPSTSYHLNVELASVLTKLGSKTSTRHILDLMETSVNEAQDIDPNLLRGNKTYGASFEKMLANQPNAKALRFALILMSAREGWDQASVKRFYAWLNDAELREGGASYKGFIANIRKGSLLKLPAGLREIANQLPKPTKEAKVMAVAKGPGRAWSVKEASEAIADLSTADYENGKKMYQAALCSKCHIHGQSGGVSGPNLTNLARRFSKKDILKSIIDPSEVISEQYEFSDITLKDGTTMTGRILSKEKDKTTLAPSAFNLSHTVSIPTANIQSITVSKVSPMPPAMINALNPEELRDLMKFLTTE